MVLVYGRKQPMDDAISSDQQSTISQYLETEALEKQSLLQPLAQRCMLRENQSLKSSYKALDAQLKHVSTLWMDMLLVA
ncbi:hypothetical protein MP228_007836 [Amoeboaphelidium protococcarum]|nr:hypothetical protein MP228_007836 [Amoeboaphelidium protococcarum]